MKYRCRAMVAVFLLLTVLLSGCGKVVGEIAGNVAGVAVKELETQVKETLRKYKVDVIEIKSTAGKLNDESDSKLQIFCSALVRSNSDALPQSAANALGKLFEDAGVQLQTESAISSPYLVHKELTFKHTDFSGGDYYLIWMYTSSLTGNLFTTETTAGVG